MTTTITEGHLAERQAADFDAARTCGDAILSAGPYGLTSAIHRSDVICSLIALEPGIPAQIGMLARLGQKAEAIEQLSKAIAVLHRHDPILFWSDLHVSPRFWAALFMRCTGGTDRESAFASADRWEGDARRRSGQELARRILAAGRTLPTRSENDRGEQATAKPFLIHRGRAMSVESREQERVVEARQSGPGFPSPPINGGSSQ